MTTLRLSVVALGLAVLTGCGGPIIIDPGPTPDPRITMYDVTSIVDHGRPRLVVNGYTPRLDFDGKRLEVHGGCDVLSAPYHLEGTRLRVSSLAATTTLGCHPELVDQEAWLVRLFARPVRFVGGPHASLTSGKVELTLTERHHRTPDALLSGTVWVLDSWFRGVGLGTWADRGLNATLTLTSVETGNPPLTRPPTSFRVDAGCAGRFGGSVYVDVPLISWRPTAFDLRSCPARSAGAEAGTRQLVAVLDGLTGFRIEGDTLVVSELPSADSRERTGDEWSLRFHRE